MTADPDLDTTVDAVRSGDRAALARAITLLESRNDDRRALGQQVLTRLLPHTGGSHRVGITGVPGVGKSTCIEALGKHLTGQGHKVAVLAVDPSSQVSGGSLLGDKTRMQGLSRDPNAFIRPSPSAGAWGGVTSNSQGALLLCEAAGYDVILVETVGAGQSETVVADTVDTFVVLLLAGAGDELQGIKRGVLELADVLAVNKADGENAANAARAAGQLKTALALLRARSAWQPPILTLSALEGAGVPELWDQIVAHQQATADSCEARRAEQRVAWMWHQVEDRLRTRLRSHPGVQGMLESTEAAVVAGSLTPGLAADRILDAFTGKAPEGHA